jgi:hypothetical protein
LQSFVTIPTPTRRYGRGYIYGENNSALLARKGPNCESGYVGRWRRAISSNHYRC